MHWRAGFNCAVAKSSTGYLTYILKILRSNIVPIAYCIDEPIAIIRFWMQAIQDRKKIDDRKIYESSKCLSSLNWNYFFLPAPYICAYPHIIIITLLNEKELLFLFDVSLYKNKFYWNIFAHTLLRVFPRLLQNQCQN